MLWLLRQCCCCRPPHPLHCTRHAAPATPAVPALQEDWDEEQHPEGFELSGGLPAAQAEQPAAAAAANGSGQAEPAVPAAAAAPAGKGALQETDDGVVLLASDSEEEEAVDATEAAVPGGSDVAVVHECPVCPPSSVACCLLRAGSVLPARARAEPLRVPCPRQARASARRAGALPGARQRPGARRRGWRRSLPPLRLARQWRMRRRRMLSWTCSTRIEVAKFGKNSVVARTANNHIWPPCLHLHCLHCKGLEGQEM